MTDEVKDVKDVTVDQLLEELSNIKLTTVPKELYEKSVESNKKLITQLANDRTPATKEDKTVSKEDIVKRVKERHSKLGSGSTMTDMKNLTENYRDMIELGMDVSGIDKDTVAGIEWLLSEAKGDENIFKTLLQTKITQPKV